MVGPLTDHVTRADTGFRKGGGGVESRKLLRIDTSGWSLDKNVVHTQSRFGICK